MKVLTIANEKGGVGKSMISTQFALYSALKFGLRVAVFDFDQQANSSNTLSKNPNVHVHNLMSVDFLIKDNIKEQLSAQYPFVLFKADDRLSILEKQGDANHAIMIENFTNNLKELSPYFDLAILDTNPNPDIRSNLGLIACTHLVSPIQLNKEPLDGITRLINRISNLAQLNPNLPDGFLGMIPNAVKAVSFQQNNAKELMTHFGKILIKENTVALVCQKTDSGNLEPVKTEGNLKLQDKLGYAVIKEHTCIAEAQSLGLPIWDMQNGKDAWSEMRKVFFSILESMHIDRTNNLTEDQVTIINDCKALFGELSSKKLIRQFFMMENSKVLPGLKPEKINALREIRKNISLDDLIAV